MGCTVRQLLASIDSRELSEWIALVNVDGPFGLERGDHQAALVSSVIANCHSSKGKFKPSDFLLQYGRPQREPQTDEDMLRVAQRINAMLGGTFEKAKKG